MLRSSFVSRPKVRRLSDPHCGGCSSRRFPTDVNCQSRSSADDGVRLRDAMVEVLDVAGSRSSSWAVETRHYALSGQSASVHVADRSRHMMMSEPECSTTSW